MGIPAEKIIALADHQSSPLFTEEEKDVLDYADAISQAPVKIPEDLYERLQKRYPEKLLVELTSAIAWENYRARFDHAFGLGAEGFSEPGLIPGGYRTLRQQA